MEAVISQTMFDTVLLQITLSGRWTCTLQATSRFALGLLLQVAHLDQLEVATTFLIRKHRHFYFWLDRLVRHNIKEVRFTLFEFQATGRILHILATEEGIYRTRSELTLGHTFDNRF